MQVGDFVETPRFLMVRIERIFDSREDAHKEGFREPTHYQGEYEILGYSYAPNHMKFAAVKK